MEKLTVEEFSNYLNTKFRVFRGDGQIFEAELVEVLELAKNETIESFSIIFLLPHEFGLEQKLYKIEHAAMGEMELFLVPVSQYDAGIRFEALFNRLVKERYGFKLS